MSLVRYYRDRSLLGTLDASNVLQYATGNFYYYHCLFGLASRGPDEPETVFRDVPRVMLSRCIPSGHVGRLQPAPICHTQLLILPRLFDLASRGQDEPQSVFLGCPQCDIIPMYHFWPRWTLPTCSNMPYTTFIPTIVCLIWPLEWKDQKLCVAYRSRLEASNEPRSDTSR